VVGAVIDASIYLLTYRRRSGLATLPSVGAIP